MKVYRVTQDNGTVIERPLSEVLNPEGVAKGRLGYGVYEAVDGRGALLYTGRTRNLAARLRQHYYTSDWWALAKQIRWIPCDDYAEVVALERAGISSDRAPYNQSCVAELPGSGRQELPESMQARLRGMYSMQDTDRHCADDLNNLIRTLREKGWTLQSIATPLSITRERVRQRAVCGVVDYELCVPEVPPRAPKDRKVWPRLTDRERQEIAELRQLATHLRGGHAEGHPYRVASERLTDALVEARVRGVRWRELAEAAGLTVGALTMRVSSHGYSKHPPSQKRYLGKPTRHSQEIPA